MPAGEHTPRPALKGVDAVTATAALLPLAAAAAHLVVRGVSDAVQEGASFAHMLTAPQPATPPQQGSATQVAANDAPELTNDSRQIRWKTATQNLDAQTEAVRQLLVAKLAASGIELSEPVVLQTDAAGHLLVANHHPQRAEIEQLLESDSTLAGQLRQLFSQSGDSGGATDVSETPDLSQVRLVVSADKAYFSYP
jgi:hypothetical protein